MHACTLSRSKLTGFVGSVSHNFCSMNETNADYFPISDSVVIEKLCAFFSFTTFTYSILCLVYTPFLSRVRFVIQFRLIDCYANSTLLGGINRHFLSYNHTHTYTHCQFHSDYALARANIVHVPKKITRIYSRLYEIASKLVAESIQAGRFNVILCRSECVRARQSIGT